MSHIYGIYNTNGAPVSSLEMELMKGALNKGVIDKRDSWQKDNVGLGNLLIHNTKESFNELLPYYFSEGELAITADARIDNREELQSLLYISDNTIADSQYILKAYQKWGVQCVDHLSGDFVFAIWDGKLRQLLLARDKMGGRSVYFDYNKERFVFASSVKAITELSSVKREISEEWLASFLVNQYSANGETAFKGIYELKPAHYCIIKKDEFINHRYFEFDAGSELHLNSDNEYVEAFKAEVIRSVQLRTRSAFNIGSELSGGLDSSSVTAIANKLLKAEGKGIYTFSNILEDSDKKKLKNVSDEREFIDIMIRYGEFADTNYISMANRNIIEMMRDYIEWHGSPPVSSEIYGMLSAELYEVAGSKNVRTILSGHGGDELPSSPAGGYRKEYLRGGKFRTYYKQEEARARLNNISSLRWFRDRALMDLFPGLLEMVQSFKGQRPNRSHKYEFVTEEIQKRLKLKERANAVLPFEKQSKVRKRQILRMEIGHLAGRMSGSTFLASKYGIEFRYPLLDERLAAFYLSLPTRQKIGEGWTRWIYRRAMEGILPPAIQWRQDKHGMIMPSHDILIYNNIEQLIKPVMDSSKSPFDVFDVDELQDALTGENLNQYTLDQKRKLNNVQKFIWLQLLQNIF